MREILFRGKTEKGEWVYGSYVNAESGGDAIIEEQEYISGIFMLSVIPETVGQDTGLKDKEGRRIFEGDIVSHEGTAYKVFFDKEDAGFYLKYFAGVVRGVYYNVAIIGNIHDNPELLEEESK